MLGIEELKNLKVDEYTSPCTIVTQVGSSVQEARELMQENQIRHLPVVDASENLVGIISERDLKVVQNKNWAEKLQVEDIMTPDPFFVNSGTTLDQVAYEMSLNKIGSAIVRNDKNQVIGIFTTTDALNALIEVLRGEVED